MDSVDTNLHYYGNLQHPNISLMRGVYAWMSVALAVTAGVALFITNYYERVFGPMSSSFFIFALIAQIIFVVALSFFITRMRFETALIMFMLYAATVGISMSVLCSFFTLGSVVGAFITSAAMFGTMALYGYTTNKDLSRIGAIAFMGLIGILIASLVNFFLRSHMAEWLISLIGVGVFCALTAHDVQKIKNMSQTLSMRDEQTKNRVALLGALVLYLDFINLFIMMLRLTGRPSRQ
jgi:uncharacterized protein